jgi:hypothetical protein
LCLAHFCFVFVSHFFFLAAVRSPTRPLPRLPRHCRRCRAAARVDLQECQSHASTNQTARRPCPGSFLTLGLVIRCGHVMPSIGSWVCLAYWKHYAIWPSAGRARLPVTLSPAGMSTN